MPGSKIEMKLVISNDNMQDYLPQVKDVNGKSFMKVYAWDRAFYRFCTGQTLQIGKGQPCPKAKFISNLAEARNQASLQQWQAFNNANNEGEGRKKRKLRMPKDSDGLTCGETVQVHAVHGLASMMLECLFGTKKAEVWIHASEANIDFVQMAIAADIRNGNLDQSAGWKKIQAGAAENDDERPDDPGARGSGDHAPGAGSATDGATS